MKTFVEKLLIFGVIVISFMALAELYTRNYVCDYNIYERLRYGELSKHEVKADTVILGASHAVNGINSNVIEGPNNKVYNFAFAGANPRYTLSWYRNIFKPLYRKPKIIIYDVNWFIFDSRWLNRKLEQDSIYFTFNTFVDLLMNKNIDRNELVSNKLMIL